MAQLIDYLGIISTAPPSPAAGDMVRRSVAGGWETINPGGAYALLRVDPTTSLPTWAIRAWANLAYTAPWVAYGGGGGYALGQYSTSADGEVVIRGLVAKTAAWVPGETICTLPVGSRPATNEVWIQHGLDATNGNLAFRIDTMSSGAVILRDVAHGASPAAKGTVTYLSLSGIQFQQGG